MSTQQDIYAAGFENRPPMLNKDNYVPWSSHLLRDPDREVPVNETFHEQIDEELTEKELKQVEANDQAIQTILLGSDIGIQEKKAKLFNEWERFTSTDEESYESYYHRFLKLMNDFKRNKHFPEKTASNLNRVEGNANGNNGNKIRCYNCRGLGQLARNYTVSPRRRDATLFRLTDLDEIKEVNANCILMANLQQASTSGTQTDKALVYDSNESTETKWKLIYNSIINGPYVKRMIPEPGDPNREVLVNETFHEQIDEELTKKELKQVEANDQAIQTILLGLPEDIYAIVDSCKTAQEIWLRVQQMMNGLDIRIQEKKAKLFNVHERHMQMVRGNGGNQSRKYAGQNVRNQNGYNAIYNVENQAIENVVQNLAIRDEGNANGNNADLDEIEEVNANCILMANLHQASTSGTQTDKALVYDSNRSAKLYNYDNFYNNEIFNIFTQEEQYTELLDPIPEPHQIQPNDSNVVYEVSIMEQDGGTVEQHHATV
nr:hypothetical protein [Tanacetum cinerariifolium]